MKRPNGDGYLYFNTLDEVDEAMKYENVEGVKIMQGIRNDYENYEKYKKFRLMDNFLMWCCVRKHWCRIWSLNLKIKRVWYKAVIEFNHNPLIHRLWNLYAYYLIIKFDEKKHPCLYRIAEIIYWGF